MILSTLFLGITNLAAAAGSPYEEVSMRCYGAVSKALSYVQKSTAKQGMTDSSSYRKYEVAQCIQSRKNPDNTFVYLSRPSDMKREHGPVYYVDSLGNVSLRRDIPCDEHPNPDVCN